MVSYRYDLYPRTDPLGTLILSMVPEITDGVVTGGLQKAAYRAEANGTSTGQLAVRSSTLAGQAIDPLGLQYVRVVELPGGNVRGGFFLEKGKFAALTEDEDHLLTFSGAGTLSYLSRASMAPFTYLSNDIDAGLGAFDDAMDPFDDTWRLSAQGFGNTLGAMLWRVVREAMLAPSGAYSHRHIATGDVTVAHDADRPETAIPAVTLTFDYTQDSSGNPWTLTSGDFTAQVGDNLLSVVKRLMEAGLYVELDPDTFELRAWEQDVHRAMLDATGGAWATDVVRFQSPTDPDDLSTGNIKDDALRNIEAHIKRSALWAGGKDIYGLATSPSDIPWEGHYRSTAADTEALEGIAEVQLQAIAEAGDTLKLRLWMEDDPANGHYLPWDHVLLDQQVTVHTGTDQWEFDERTFPVAALTVELKPAGNWDCIVELGASYSATPSRQFQVQGAGAHTHPPGLELCRPLTVTEDTLLGEYLWDTAPDYDETIPAIPSLSQPAVVWTGSNVGGNPNGFASSLPSADAGINVWTAVTPGQEYTVAITQGRASGASNPSYFGIEWVSGAYDGGLGAAAWTTISRDSITFTSTTTIQSASITATAPMGATGFRLIDDDGVGTYDTYRIFSLSISQSGGASGEGVHPALAGTSTSGKRCDDTEHYHTNRAPTVDDDTTLGFRNGTLWFHETSGEHWLLLDNADGAADWLKVGYGEPAARLVIEEEDGTPSGTFTTLKVPNGSLTDNGDGTASLAAGGGASAHASSHEDGGADEVTIENLPTGESDTAKVLHPDGSGGVVWGTDATGGGGGGNPWQLVVDQSGASFADWTGGTGTWASDGAVIQQTASTASTYLRAALTASYNQGRPMIYECDIRVDAVQGSGNQIAALHLFSSGGAGTGGPMVGLDMVGGGRVIYGNNGTNIVIATSPGLSTATWYTMHFEIHGLYLSIYLDGTLVGNFNLTSLANLRGGDKVGVLCFNTRASFRNIKWWTLVDP